MILMVRQALHDSNEGVVARAIHVAGQLSLVDVVPQIAFASQGGVLTFSALMSLGLMSESDAVRTRDHIEGHSWL